MICIRSLRNINLTIISYTTKIYKNKMCKTVFCCKMLSIIYLFFLYFNIILYS